jgi:hypothetical protein
MNTGREGEPDANRTRGGAEGKEQISTEMKGQRGEPKKKGIKKRYLPVQGV